MGLDYDLIYFLIMKLGRTRLLEYVDPYKDSLKTYLIPTTTLNPHEEVYDDNLKLVTKELINCGYMKYPIVADVRTLSVLDGHHRLEAFKAIGVGLIPTFLVDYAQDYIEVYPRRKDIYVSKVSIADIALSKKPLYPPKTTRHVYRGFQLQPINISISLLRKVQMTTSSGHLISLYDLKLNCH